MSEHILGDGSFGDIDAEDLEFPVYARGVPEGVLPRELANEGGALRGNQMLAKDRAIEVEHGPASEKAGDGG